MSRWDCFYTQWVWSFKECRTMTRTGQCSEVCYPQAPFRIQCIWSHLRQVHHHRTEQTLTALTVKRYVSKTPGKMFPKSIKRLFYHPDMTQCIWAFRIKTCLPGNLKSPQYPYATLHVFCRIQNVQSLTVHLIVKWLLNPKKWGKSCLGIKFA